MVTFHCINMYVERERLVFVSGMYDPESPWMTDVINHVLQPSQRPTEQHRQTVTWDSLRTDLKHVIIEHYQHNKRPITVYEIMNKLDTDNLAVRIDQELLVVLLDNLGCCVTKH